MGEKNEKTLRWMVKSKAKNTHFLGDVFCGP